MLLPPLSLYIHFPWCLRKCPYCDFNSHSLKGDLPEANYIQRVLANADHLLPFVQGRSLISLFLGGGTPSLFSASSLETLFEGLKARFIFSSDIEITLEANPSTVEQNRFQAYSEIGINRISLGIQSFNATHLKALGRIHNSQEASSAIETVKKVGFRQWNCDLMFGLPHQTVKEGLRDLEEALAFDPPHLSWYELTIEPNTVFSHRPPPLPPEDERWILEQAGQDLLALHGLQRYEVSAYTQKTPCLHNTHYWQFGDYLALGAGAHGKITLKGKHYRYSLWKHPKQYLDTTKGFIAQMSPLEKNQLPFEFMLNALRLKEGVPASLFLERTFLPLTTITPHLTEAQKRLWMTSDRQRLSTTPLGYRFLNDVVSLFLPPPRGETHALHGPV